MITFFLLLALCTTLYSSEHFRLQATGEGGVFLTDAYGDNSIFRMIGNLRYYKTFPRTYFQLKMRLAPEVYDEKIAASAVKTKTALTFGGHNDVLVAWRFNLNHRYYFYNLGLSGHLQYHILYFSAQASWPHKKRSTWLAQTGYFFRDIRGRPYTRLLSYAAQGGIGGYFMDLVNYQLKLYLEHFSIRAAASFTDNTRNRGIRFGPLLSIQYSRDYLFNASYLLIFEDNLINKKILTEHNIRLVAGKYLSDRLSLFVYLKYFIRSSEEVVDKPLTYTPLDSENWFYAKAGYDVSNSAEFFLRLGYITDTLPGRKEELGGWQVLAGIHYIFGRE